MRLVLARFTIAGFAGEPFDVSEIVSKTERLQSKELRDRRVSPDVAKIKVTMMGRTGMGPTRRGWTEQSETRGSSKHEIDRTWTESSGREGTLGDQYYQEMDVVADDIEALEEISELFLYISSIFD